MESIDRRTFFLRSAAFGAAVLTGSMLAGCAPRSESSNADRNAPVAKTSTETSASNEGTSQTQPVQPKDGKALIAVFSWSGNTFQVAERIHEHVESDLFRIEPATPYTTDYDEMLDVAQAEQRNGDMPAIASIVSDWDSYDVVYLGYPIWWYDAPQIIKSFVSQYDFTGKTVVPFCTSGGSRLESTLSEVKELCPGAEFLDGITLSGDTVASHLSEVDAWLNGLGL